MRRSRLVVAVLATFIAALLLASAVGALASPSAPAAKVATAD